jgi:hypothetical protein
MTGQHILIVHTEVLAGRLDYRDGLWTATRRVTP